MKPSPSFRRFLVLVLVCFAIGTEAELWGQDSGQGLEARGDTWLADRNIDSAIWAFRTLLKQAEKENDPCQTSLALRKLADVAQKSDSLAKAGIYASRSVLKARECSDTAYLSQALVQAGGVYFRESAYGAALPLFQEAARLAEKAGTLAPQLPLYFYLGQIYLNQGNHLAAIASFKKGLALANRSQAERQGVNYLVVLVRAYGQAHATGQQDSLIAGLGYYRAALAHPATEGLPAIQAAARIYLGEYYTSLVGTDSALRAVQHAQGLLPAGSRNLAYAYKVESELWLQREDIPNAIATARRSLEMAKRLGLPEISLAAYKVLHPALMETGDYRGAYEALGMYKSLDDSLTHKRSRQEVLDLQVQYETESLAREQAKLTRENQLLRSRGRLAWAVVILLGIIVLGGLWFFWRLSKKNEIILRQTSALQRSNKAKDQLFAVIAHDLRGPFISFQGLTQKFSYLQRKGKTDMLEKVHEHIEQTARQLNNLLDNLLAWAIQQREGQPYPAESVSIARAVEQQCEDFRPAYDAKQIHCETRIEEGLAAWVAPPVLATILRNLISNAIKFSRERDTIRLLASAEGDNMVLRLEDEGPGVTPEVRVSLFELDPGHSKPGSAGEKGVGLGLSLCRELAQASGGSLKLDEEYSQGAAFELRLPLPPRE